MESKTLFEIEMTEDFVRTIAEMNARELRQHLCYANSMIKKLRGELEDLSHVIIEYEKHGTGYR